MNKVIISIIIGIFLISLASAELINITAGDSYSFNLEEQYAYYSIEGNNSEVDLNITQNGTIITILINKYMKSDSFTITFYKEKDEPISSSGGSRGGGVCFRGYTLSNWSECINNSQTREVKKDWKICYLKKQEKPAEIQSCEIIEDLDDVIPLDDETPDRFYLKIGLGAFLLLLILIFVKLLVNYIRKWKKQKLVKS